MGDLVLTKSEISPVMQKMAEGGIAITALHNHLLRARPPTVYMHVLGQGDPVKLAKALHDGLALSATPFAAPANTGANASDLDVTAIDQIGAPRARPMAGWWATPSARGEDSKTMACMPPAMGSAIGINFQPTGGEKAAITGDFVLLGPR